MSASQRVSRGFHRVRLLLAGVVLSLMLTGAAAAGPFEDGLAAYRSGNYAAAALLWRPLAEQGLGQAQHNLGLMYDRGQGVPQDYAEAVKWLRLAAEQGFAQAQYFLGVSYAEGQGVPQDDAEAVKWYRLAAGLDASDQHPSQARSGLSDTALAATVLTHP